MKISQRSYLAVVPAALGVLLVAGLAFRGRYDDATPSLILVGGGLAVLGSLALARSNARQVAGWLERPERGAAPTDDVRARAPSPSAAVEAQPLVERRSRDYARLLAMVADASTTRLDEVRLPLHILLENRFGELNENQEEMLGAARAAAEAVDADMISLRQIAELDLGERPLRRDPIKPSELIDALRPLLVAAAESAGVSIDVDVTPLLPAITGDRALLQDALATLMRDAVTSAKPDARVRVQVDRNGQTIRFAVLGAGSPPASVRSAAAGRVVDAHGGSVERRDGELRITSAIG